MNFRAKCLVMLCFCLCSLGSRAADSTDTDSSQWEVSTKTSLFFAQSSYGQYWKGSGRNSLELGGGLDFSAKRTYGKTTLESKVIVQYGVIKVGEKPLQKNEDRLELEVRLGKQVSKLVKLSGLFNFRTHLHDFYSLDAEGDRLKQTGNFLAPGFIHLGTGIDMSTKDKILRMYYTPLNSKLTVVTEPDLRPQYLPSEWQDQAVRYELGSLMKIQLQKELMTNIIFKSTSTFFTSHLKDFGKFDVNLEGDLNFKVNKFFQVNLRTQLIYDEDIKFELLDEEGESSGEKGPRTQFREVLNVGLSHTF